MRDLKHKKKKKFKQNRLKAEKKPRDWKKLFLRSLRVSMATGTGVLLLFGGILTGQMLLDSGYFAVNQVRVEQQNRVTEREILEASDIESGDSLFDLDLHLIGRKIEEHPWIAKAEVNRVFPDQVLIRVSERTPRAIVDLDYLYYVDDQGEIFKILDSSDHLGYIVISGIDRQELLEHEGAATAWLRKALVLMGELEKRRLFSSEKVSEIHYDHQEGFVLYTYRGGVPVYIGRDNFAEKLSRLEQVFVDLEPRLSALAYIDLNVTDRVIVKIDTKKTIARS